MPEVNCTNVDDEQSLFQKPVGKKNVLSSVVILTGLIISAIFLATLIDELTKDAILSNQLTEINRINYESNA